MKIQKYMPIQSTIVAGQWPERPTLFDHQDLHKWLGVDVMFAGEGGVWLQEPDKTTELKPGNWVVRDDDGFHIYTEEQFSDRFAEL